MAAAARNEFDLLVSLADIRFEPDGQSAVRLAHAGLGLPISAWLWRV
jgi:hypothetical protein